MQEGAIRAPMAAAKPAGRRTQVPAGVINFFPVLVGLPRVSTVERKGKENPDIGSARSLRRKLLCATSGIPGLNGTGLSQRFWSFGVVFVNRSATATL